MQGLLVGGDTYAYQLACPDKKSRAKQWDKLAQRHGVSLQAVAMAFATLPTCVTKLVIGEGSQRAWNGPNLTTHADCCVARDDDSCRTGSQFRAAGCERPGASCTVARGCRAPASDTKRAPANGVLRTALCRQPVYGARRLTSALHVYVAVQLYSAAANF